MSTVQAPPPQWVRDLISPPSFNKTKTNTSLPDPPGYTTRSTLSKPNHNNNNKSKSAVAEASTRKPPTVEEMDTLKLKKAWELAIAPAKQIPMNAIGMYMSGNSLQIFSIMMCFMLFKGPIVAIFSVSDVFTRFETDGTRSRLLGVKAVYVVMNLLLLGLGVWKVNGMGLLPTHRSDWLAWETYVEPVIRAHPARSF